MSSQILKNHEIYDLYTKLYVAITGKSTVEALRHVTEYMTNNQQQQQNSQTTNTTTAYDETTLLSKISSHLLATKSQAEVAQFMQIYEKFVATIDAQHRNTILTFLFDMAESNKMNGGGNSSCSSSSNIGNSGNNNGNNNVAAMVKQGFALRMNLSSLSSALDKHRPQNAVSGESVSGVSSGSASGAEKIYPKIPVKPTLIPTSTTSENLLKIAQFKRSQQQQQQQHHHHQPFSGATQTGSSTDDSCSTRDDYGKTTHRDNRIASATITPELIDELVQDVIYSFTGVEGNYLKKDIISGGFKLNPKTSRQLNVTYAGMLLRLGEVGYYHNQVESFTDPKSGRSPFGLLGQGLVTALNSELTNYYGMVALLQEQLNRYRESAWGTLSNQEKGERITLMKLMLWSRDPLHRLKALVNIADACQEKKGGELATVVSTFQIIADPVIRVLVKQLMRAVCGPLQIMLSKWLLEGEINDPYSEFFIEILPEIGDDRLWSDKYRVRAAMLPTFISPELANKILITGKSVNFLREVCQDKTASIKGKDELRKCFENNPDNLFAFLPDTKLHMLIDTVYLNTSQRVLDIVKGPYKLLQHLQIMRNYLLLGKGDFVGILMESLKPELDRPAKELQRHELSGLLDSAIRSTNAQFDDQEMLSHLDVRLMGNFEGDTGWDTFLLKYTVCGPLSTMLEPTMIKYQQLFKPLWRMKHLELVLSSKIWKEQMCNAKLLRSMQKELSPIMYRLHLYSSEMIHFIHQMQYYISFEVIECLWTNMLEKIKQSTTLDEILDAHQEFLREVKIGTFLDENDTIYCRLGNVFSTITKLELWQDKFYELCFKEQMARKRMLETIKSSETKGKYGVTAEEKFERDEELKIFEYSMCQCQKSLEKIGTDYEVSVRHFLLLLAKSTDHNLQLFGTRLDFNEYYKKRDERLDVPLTFANMRYSSMMTNTNNNNNNNQNKNNILRASGRWDKI